MPEAHATLSPSLTPQAIAAREAMGIEVCAPKKVEVLPVDLDGPPSPCTLRHTHHQMARLIALGRKPVEVAAAVGYSAGYVSAMLRSPAFAELVRHYEHKQDEIFVDVATRLKDLGLVAVEELLERITENPKDIPRSQLIEIIELLFGKSGAAKAAGLAPERGASTPGVAVQVTFVGGKPGPDVIDVTPRVISNGNP